jgi:holin-like protein
MADPAPSADSRGDAPTSGPLRRLAILCLQLGLLSLVYAGWLGIGQQWMLPLPAGLLGMLSVLGLLVTRLLPLSAVQRGAGFLLRYIGLLFVPVCVGAVRQLPLLRTQGWAFAVLIIAGALVGQATSGLLAQALCRKPAVGPAPESFES